MKNFWIEPEQKKINKKKVTIVVIVVIVLILFATIAIIYSKNKEARYWIDKNILQKEKTQNNLPSIDVDVSDDSNIYAFNKYIGVLDKNNFKIYDSSGKEENKLTIEITKPIFNYDNRYLVVAEEKGQKLYLIEDKEIVWEKEIEGNISQVVVNKNGYVAITIVDTLYKTTIEMYDNKGEELFKTFLKSTRVVSTSRFQYCLNDSVTRSLKLR